MVHSTPYLYADDTKCLNTIRSLTDTYSLQYDLDNVSLWSLRWKLFFNENKFVHIRFHSLNHNGSITYKINDRVIDCKLHHKDLGIFFNNNLTWTDHYDHIITKAYNTLGLLHRTFKTNNVQVKKQLYISLVWSQLAIILFTTLETTTYQRYSKVRAFTTKSHQIHTEQL